jgi:ubiquinone/menaquinone biosynthesis C-methylase UbiE
MTRHVRHAMQPKPTADEFARQMFVLSLKGFVRKMRPINKLVWQQRGLPAFQAAHGRDPANATEVASVMDRQLPYQTYSALNRTAQEMMWSSLLMTIEREEPALRARAKTYTAPETAKGSLHLDAAFDPPLGLKQVNIHLQPMGFTIDRDPEDLIGGLLYEAGHTLYSQGSGVGVSETKPETVRRWLAKTLPDFMPTRILDIGTSAGGSATPWALMFPEAEVHAVDVGGSMLRYAHARAEALGAKVHFHQMSADDLKFPDGMFDLVVSHNALHEMPMKTAAEMMKASFRLLAPGGIVVHQDVPVRLEGKGPFEMFEQYWEVFYNNEPYWISYGMADFAAMLRDAGFAAPDLWSEYFLQSDNTVPWLINAARKPAVGGRQAKAA